MPALPTADPIRRRATRLCVAGVGAAAALALVTTVLAVPADDAGDLCAAGFGSLVGTSDRLNDAAKLLQSSFDKANWTGNVRAYALESDGTVRTTPLWQAASQLPVAASRTIFTASSSAAGVDFRWDVLPDPLKDKIGDEATLNYLRGDQSGEVAQGGLFRSRVSRLGPIVNSEIALAGVQNFGYDVLPGAEGSSYAGFMQTKAARTHLAIVGANDGMLHGFDAATGVEKFAYVPQALMLEPISAADQRSTLVRLADPDFQPRYYYVDGSSWVADAYWNSAWHTVVVGTAGNGGKGVFAIDVTAPNAMSPNKLLFDHWDVEGGNDANLGHSFGQPVVGRLADGDFYAIFGNGRDSVHRCPVLYLARLRDGVVRRIPTGGRNLAASCSAAPNGLGRPSLYDAERAGEAGYRITDFVYAGDLQGNVWRFDLRSLNVGTEPPSGAGAQLLFAAQNDSGEVQPITGTIELGPAPGGVVGNPRPVMLWFGTGRYLATTDAGDTRVQSMYGMVDRFAVGGNATTAKILRSDLQGQTANLSGDLAGTISGTPVNYPGGQHGWVVDLPRTGERMTGLPLLQPGRLLFATFVPEANACYATGQSWLFAVDPYHGRSLAQRIFVGSPNVDFIASTVGIVRSFVAVEAGNRAFVYIGGSGSNGNSIQREEIRPVTQGNARGRVSWREIVR